MNWLAKLRQARRQAKALAKLEAMRRPDADYRNRRLAQFSPERRERALRNIQAIYGGEECSNIELSRMMSAGSTNQPG